MRQNFTDSTRSLQGFMRYSAQFGVLLAFFGIGIMLASGLLFLYISMTDKSNSIDLAKINIDALNPNTLRLMQAVGSVLQFGLPSLMLAVILKKKPGKFYKLHTLPSTPIWLYVIALAVLGTAFSDLLARINEAIPVSDNIQKIFAAAEETYFSQVLKIVDLSSLTGLAITLFIIAALPAFFEELLFRGALQPVMTGWLKNVFWGIFISAFLFSIMHLSFYGFLPRLFLGITLGYIFYYSQSLWASIAFHFLNNAFAVITFYVLSLHGNIDYAKASEHMSLTFTLPGSILFIIVFYFFRKYALRKIQQAASC